MALLLAEFWGREIFGYSAEEVKGRSVSILIPPDRS